MKPSARMALRGAIVVAFVTCMTVVAVDAIAFWCLPASLTAFAPQYRASPEADDGAPAWLTYTSPYPRGYFQSDAELGFDIAPNVGPLTHHFADGNVRVFSNDLGCFDTHRGDDVTRAAFFDYFAGDSFTWGYTDLEKKYPTIYERVSGRLSLKCGVSHTGQRHQFEKFRRLVARLGRYPQTVFVGYYANDPANDHVHPHSAVVQGLLVDAVYLEPDGRVVRRTSSELEERLTNWRTAQARDAASLEGRVRGALARYSLTASLVRTAWSSLTLRSGNGGPGHQPSLYGLSERVAFDESYAVNPLTAANRAALAEWAADSRANRYSLVVLLIPPREHATTQGYYGGLKRYLSGLGVRSLDVVEGFSSVAAADLYWPHDGHLNELGNRVVGEFLATRMRTSADQP